MSDTPIGDAVEAEVYQDTGDAEPYADTDPDPVLNDDHADDFSDLEDGEDNDEDLDGE